jgi:3-dehydroquinate synthase
MTGSSSSPGQRSQPPGLSLLDRCGPRATAIEQLQTCLAIPSPLFLGCGIEDQLPAALAGHDFDQLFLFSEPSVFCHFGESLQNRLQASFPCELLMVASGESCKTFASLEEILERLIDAGASKRSLLIAFGGGAVGNLVGMAAALLFRGVRYIEIPTTMTGQTDSVLSNKQAINGSSGKNLFGVYHAPAFIWVDTFYLKTEPLASRRSGIVEGIKNGFIASPSFLAYLEAVLEPSHNYSDEQRHRLVRSLIHSKLPILQQDPSEQHSAITLEYGHTFGHGLEFLLKGRMMHGEAVGIGMRIAARLAQRLGLIDADLVQQHDHLIVDKLGFHTAWPTGIEAGDLLQAMTSDNKKKGRDLRYVLLAEPGRCANPEGDWMMHVDPSVVREVLEAFIAESVLAAPSSSC